jgi:hypothetical protein
MVVQHAEQRLRIDDSHLGQLRPAEQRSHVFFMPPQHPIVGVGEDDFPQSIDNAAWQGVTDRIPEQGFGFTAADLLAIGNPHDELDQPAVEKRMAKFSRVRSRHCIEMSKQQPNLPTLDKQGMKLPL